MMTVAGSFPYAQYLRIRPSGRAPAFARRDAAEHEVLPRIEGYRIERRVGAGRTAIAYLARDIARGGKCVLKVLRAEHAGSVTGQTSFIQEFAAPSALRNKHIVRVFERLNVGEHSVISMEYLGGGDLSRLIRCGLAADEAVSLLRQAACALAGVHANGWVHCDVKPANLLLRYSGDLVLADFGLARRMDTAPASPNAGVLVGTPSYASPEQAEGDPGGSAADVYSLGVVFYEMLCGRPPFPGQTLMEVLCQHMMAPVPRLPAQLARFQSLIDSMLAKKVNHRLPDGQALLEQIDWTQNASRLHSAPLARRK